MGGDDLIDGGDGNDRADYTNATVGVEVDLYEGWARDGSFVNGVQGEDTLLHIEWVRGSGFADILVGNEEDNKLEGMAGNDSMEGGGGDDLLIGAAGSDTFYFFGETVSADTDTIQDFEMGDSLVLGGLSVESLVNAAPEELTVGQAALSGTALYVRFAEGEEGLLTIELGVELSSNHFRISAHEEGVQLTYRPAATEDGDWLYGGDNNDFIEGLGGNDYIFGLEGNDTVAAGDGDDFIVGGGAGSEGRTSPMAPT
ncbi:hypothetical protein HK414_05260 [Ramlibacter terrae]|uniref:Calcium-binding protein n=1 Tax=Ramlibacter terrae TaxID=2732511 RepID=A0ABX6P0V7_9BURK|nr:hypothetical protein HK414_05260 [Ramlibacter terrae]